MKLKNEALQELYDTIVNCTIAISPYADSQMDKAFKDCDEKLQKDIDIWRRSNEILLSANSELAGEKRQLQKDHESDVRVIGKLHSQMANLEDEKTEQEKRADILKSQRDMLKKEIDQLKKDKERLEHSRLEWAKRAVERGKKLNEASEKNQELKNQLYKANSDRTELQKDRDIWFRNNGEKQAEIADLKNQLDGAIEDKKSLVVSRYKWAQKWLSTKQNLETKLNEAEVKYRRLEKEHEKLISEYQTITIENKRLQDGLRGIGYEQGQTDLWDMLQNVNDTQPNEFDVECESMHDVIGMDLEDFLDAYKKWQEQKETDRMREWLVDFCNERWCHGCPLRGDGFKCGRGYGFDTTIRIPDEDIKRYYEAAHGCGRYTMKDDPCSGVHEKIKEACDAFSEGLKTGLASEVKEAPVSCDIPIKDLASWECTLEANVGVNKDLFEKLCGMKSEEKKPNPKGLVITTRGVTTANYSEATMNAIKEAVRKFEKSLPALDSWESTITGSIKVDDIPGKTASTKHEFEYGDAVRLPWRDYDYMYIDADKNHIRLFDPKSHTVIFVSPSEKLTYQGTKIILTNEEDLIKIWKAKK